jgi:hypothetical protein
MKDIAALIHRTLYDKSDKANAQENRNSQFQAGYEHGISENEGGTDLIAAEYERRNEPGVETVEFALFREWKRGFWAGRMQKSFTKAQNQ